MPRRNVLRSQARQMVHDVLTFMKNEAQEGLQYDLKAVQKRTAAATGVSERTVRRIANVANAPGASLHEVFRTPGRRRTGRKKVTAMNSTKLGTLKRYIHNYHKTERELPTVKVLLKKLKEVVDFKGQVSSLRRVLTELGFKWKKTEDSGKILVEQVGIRQKRIEYLQAISQYRAEGRPVIFVDSSFVDTVASDNLAKGLKKYERVVIINAASQDGFLPMLQTYKNFNKNDDNRQYEKWFRTQMIPNIPADAIVVVGKAPFFNKSVDAAPTSTSKRSVMETWLQDKGIPFTSTMLKPQLYKLVCTYKSGFKQYRLDTLLNENNHPVLRFPPCHPDLNPLDTAWTAIKSYVASKNARTVDVVKRLVKEQTVALNDEIGILCRKVKSIEEEYGRSDAVIDELTDAVSIHVSDDESDDDTDDGSGSEEEQPDESSSEEEVASEAEVMEVTVSPEVIID